MIVGEGVKINKYQNHSENSVVNVINTGEVISKINFYSSSFQNNSQRALKQNKKLPFNQFNYSISQKFTHYA